MKQASRAQANFAKFEAANKDKIDDPSIAKTRERLYQMSVESSRRLNNFKADPQAFMQDEQRRENAAQADKAKEAKSYEVLGISKAQIESLPLNEQEELLKSRYRNLSRAHHPDKNIGNPESHAKFQEISNAYEHAMQMFENRRDNNVQPKKPKNSSKPSSPPQNKESANPTKESGKVPDDLASSKTKPHVEADGGNSTVSRDSSSSVDNSSKNRTSSIEEID